MDDQRDIGRERLLLHVANQRSGPEAEVRSAEFDALNLTFGNALQLPRYRLDPG